MFKDYQNMNQNLGKFHLERRKVLSVKSSYITANICVRQTEILFLVLSFLIPTINLTFFFLIFLNIVNLEQKILRFFV